MKMSYETNISFRKSPITNKTELVLNLKTPTREKLSEPKELYDTTFVRNLLIKEGYEIGDVTAPSTVYNFSEDFLEGEWRFEYKTVKKKETKKPIKKKTKKSIREKAKDKGIELAETENGQEIIDTYTGKRISKEE